MSFEPDARDLAGVDRVAEQMRRSDQPVEVKCFNHAEAVWFRHELETRGFPPGRFLMSWLEFPRKATA